MEPIGERPGYDTEHTSSDNEVVDYNSGEQYELMQQFNERLVVAKEALDRIESGRAEPDDRKTVIEVCRDGTGAWLRFVQLAEEKGGPGGDKVANYYLIHGGRITRAVSDLLERLSKAS